MFDCLYIKRRTKLIIFVYFSAKALSIQKNIVALHKELEKEIEMATPIKAVPTLYGDEARRFREMADEAERKFDMRPKRDLTKDPRYKATRTILERSKDSIG